MESIKNITELNAAILVLQNKQAEQALLIKEQYKITYESLRPVNLIKNTSKELVIASDFKDDLLNTSLGLVSGYLSKKVAIGTTNNPFKQILGSFLQMGVSNVVSKNADDIRATFMGIVSAIFSKKENR